MYIWASSERNWMVVRNKCCVTFTANDILKVIYIKNTAFYDAETVRSRNTLFKANKAVF